MCGRRKPRLAEGVSGREAGRLCREDVQPDGGEAELELRAGRGAGSGAARGKNWAACGGACESRTYEMTCSACAQQNTKISCTPDAARNSSVYSIIGTFTSGISAFGTWYETGRKACGEEEASALSIRGPAAGALRGRATQAVDLREGIGEDDGLEHRLLGEVAIRLLDHCW